MASGTGREHSWGRNEKKAPARASLRCSYLLPQLRCSYLLPEIPTGVACGGGYVTCTQRHTRSNLKDFVSEKHRSNYKSLK